MSHALCNDADLYAISRTDGERLFNGFKPAKLRKLIEHEEKPLLFRFLAAFFVRIKLHIAHELREHRVHEEAQDGAQLVDVVRLQHEIKRDFSRRIEEIAQGEVGNSRVLFDERILVDRHRGLRCLHDGSTGLFSAVVHVGRRFSNLRVHKQKVPRWRHLYCRINFLLVLRAREIGRREVELSAMFLKFAQRPLQEAQVAFRRFYIASSLLQGFFVFLRLLLVFFDGDRKLLAGKGEGTKIFDVFAVNLLEDILFPVSLQKLIFGNMRICLHRSKEQIGAHAR